MKHPSSNIQAPEKRQAAISNAPASILGLGDWNFSGVWMLEFGAFS
jgi:hypothetical protein